MGHSVRSGVRGPVGPGDRGGCVRRSRHLPAPGDRSAARGIVRLAAIWPEPKPRVPRASRVRRGGAPVPRPDCRAPDPRRHGPRVPGADPALRDGGNHGDLVPRARSDRVVDRQALLGPLADPRHCARVRLRVGTGRVSVEGARLGGPPAAGRMGLRPGSGAGPGRLAGQEHRPVHQSQRPRPLGGGRRRSRVDAAVRGVARRWRRPCRHDAGAEPVAGGDRRPPGRPRRGGIAGGRSASARICVNDAHPAERIADRWAGGCAGGTDRRRAGHARHAARSVRGHRSGPHRGASG